VHHKAWMLGQPFSDFVPMMRADIVAHEMNGVDVLVNLRIQHFQKGDAFPLALPLKTLPIDLARTGVKGRKEIEGPSALILVLVPVGNVLRLGWPGRSATRSRLQGGLSSTDNTSSSRRNGLV
jgi:hypothetical protein